MTKFQAVIFDFGGVFTTSPVEKFAAFEQKNGLPERYIGSIIKTNHNTNAWAQFERAEITPAEFDSAFAAESKAAGYEIRGSALVGLIALELRPEMAKALRLIKQSGLKTGCITNNLPQTDSTAMVSDPGRLAQAAQIFEDFDHIIESAKAGVRKPEPRIYEMMCKALGVTPDASIFIDDLGINLKPARAMGMETIKAPIGDIRPVIDRLSGLLGISLSD